MKEGFRRVGILDDIRGLCVVLMVGYHALYDLVDIFGLDVPMFRWGVTSFARTLVAATFMFIAAGRIDPVGRFGADGGHPAGDALPADLVWHPSFYGFGYAAVRFVGSPSQPGFNRPRSRFVRWLIPSLLRSGMGRTGLPRLVGDCLAPKALHNRVAVSTRFLCPGLFQRRLLPALTLDLCLFGRFLCGHPVAG